jgi:hypothetical protein
VRSESTSRSAAALRRSHHPTPVAAPSAAGLWLDSPQETGQSTAIDEGVSGLLAFAVAHRLANFDLEFTSLRSSF